MPPFHKMYTIDHRAAVVYANAYQFGSKDRIHYPTVQSRVLLWCKSGYGEVRVNGQHYALAVDRFLVLPWEHAITYQADAKEPFLVAAIHLIPHHSYSHDVVFQVAHFPESPLYGLPWRRDRLLGLGSGVHHGVISWNGGLGYLAEYILHVFMRGNPSEWQARYLARLLIEEVHVALGPSGQTAPRLPVALQQIMQYVRDHRQQALRLKELADFSGKSSSTVTRLFQRHLNCTPNQWIQRYRMEQARRLLRSSRMPVAEVGRAVGIGDQYYFSKLFKKMIGQSPLVYRKKGGLL